VAETGWAATGRHVAHLFDLILLGIVQQGFNLAIDFLQEGADG
jgi:hypothetical protein